jgi:hypothetical protein
MPRRLLIGAAALAGALVAVLAVRIYAAGYGADNDTWLMLGTWDVLVDQHRYVPSRPPGYLVPELVIGATSEVAGHWSSNLVSLVLGVTTLWLVHRLVRRRTPTGAPAVLLVVVLALTPAFVVASTTSMDYAYGLAGFLAGWVLLEDRRPAWAGGVLLGVAAVCRLAYAPLGLVVVLLGPGRGRPVRDRVVAVAVLALVTALGYVPALRATGDLSFVTAERPTGQGAVGVAGRAILKGGDLLGLVGSLAGVVVVILAVRAARARRQPAIGEWWLLVVVGVQLAVWLWIPAEPSYLLPALVALLVWLARPTTTRAVTVALGVLVAALAAYAVVDVRLVEVDHENRYGYDTCDPTEATGAALKPHVTTGPLLGYPATQDALRTCNEAQRAAQQLVGEAP